MCRDLVDSDGIGVTRICGSGVTVLNPDDLCAGEPLNDGKWLLLLVGSYSAPDIAQIRDVFLKVAADHPAPERRLAVGAFGDPPEVWRWFPATRGNFASPFWIAIDDGHVSWYEAAIFTPERLTALLRDHLD